MSLKDEIQKLIDAERQKLVQQDHKIASYHQRQKDNFQSLRALLEEIAKSVEPAYLKSQLSDGQGTLDIGRQECKKFEVDVHWEIKPNFEIKFGAMKGESPFEEAPGFLVEEICYYRFPEPDRTEQKLIFESEQAVIEYLLKIITAKVAYFEKTDAAAKRILKDKRPNTPPYPY